MKKKMKWIYLDGIVALISSLLLLGNAMITGFIMPLVAGVIVAVVGLSVMQKYYAERNNHG